MGDATDVETLDREVLLERETLSRRILNQDDVKTVLGLRKVSEGQWLYFIETPFPTWPKYVIGTSDFELETFVPLFRCGLLDGAKEEWRRRKERAEFHLGFTGSELETLLACVAQEKWASPGTFAQRERLQRRLHRARLGLADEQ